MSLCNNKTLEERIKICNVILVMLGIVMVMFLALMVWDLISGTPISASNLTVFCAGGTIFSANVINRRKLVKELEERDKN